MRISRMMSCAAVAAALLAAAVPAPGNAQLGKLLKKAAKQKVVETVIDKTGGVAGEQPDTTATGQAAPVTGIGAMTATKGARAAPPQPGPRFSEYLLEMTPELLDRFEKGLAAELAVRQDIDRLIGKQLAPEAYRECTKAVMSSPEAQQVYMQAGDLMTGDTTYAHIQKASQEMARRFDKLVEPKCGLNAIKADEIRRQHADRLEAAAPEASGLTTLQLSLLKERIIPLCAAIETLAEVAGEARIATESAAIYWVYTRGEVAALQPRCAKLSAALKTAL